MTQARTGRGRKPGEVYLAVLQAAEQLDAFTLHDLWLDLCAKGPFSRKNVERTVENLSRRGHLAVTGTVRVQHCSKRVARYALASRAAAQEPQQTGFDFSALTRVW